VRVSIFTFGHWLVNLKNLAPSNRVQLWSYVPVDATVYDTQSRLEDISEKLPPVSVVAITKLIFVSQAGSFHIQSAPEAVEIILFPDVGTHLVAVLK